MFAKDDGEAFQLALEIRNFLRKAEWIAPEPVPIPATAEPQPSSMAVDGQPSGITVAANAISQAESDAIFFRNPLWLPHSPRYIGR